MLVGNINNAPNWKILPSNFLSKRGSETVSDLEGRGSMVDMESVPDMSSVQNQAPSCGRRLQGCMALQRGRQR